MTAKKTHKKKATRKKPSATAKQQKPPDLPTPPEVKPDKELIEQLQREYKEFIAEVQAAAMKHDSIIGWGVVVPMFLEGFGVVKSHAGSKVDATLQDNDTRVFKSVFHRWGVRYARKACKLLLPPCHPGQIVREAKLLGKRKDPDKQKNQSE